MGAPMPNSENTAPTLGDLPRPPEGKTGWPWTEASDPLPDARPNGDPWPKVSVVTPSYNHGRFIEKTIRSVLLQGYPNLEYIVMDGGSDDETVEILEKYDPWIDDWVSEPDDGQSAAINAGFRRSSGQFGSWINSDDWLCQGALVNHASRVGFSEECLYAGICYAYRDGEKIQKISTDIQSVEDLVRLSEYWGAFYLGNSDAPRYITQPETLFPLDKFWKVSGLNEEKKHAMDYALWGDLLIEGLKVVSTDVRYGVIRRHEQQKTSNRTDTTKSIVKKAHKIIEKKEEFEKSSKEDLHKHVEEYKYKEKNIEEVRFRKSGRLAKMGLPKGIVSGLRHIKGLFSS